MATTDASSKNVGARLRTRFALVQSQLSVEGARSRWAGFPESLRAMLQRTASRVRDRLDIPSKSELHDLVERIEALDRKLEQAQATRASDLANLERKLSTSASAKASKPKAKRTRKKRPTDAPRPRRTKSKPRAEADRPKRARRKPKAD